MTYQQTSMQSASEMIQKILHANRKQDWAWKIILISGKTDIRQKPLKEAMEDTM